MKNTAKTLTLTAKKAPAKNATAQLAVPKTATSYFLETEAAAKVTVVKTRSRLASLKAQAEAVANDAVTAEPAAAAPEAVEAAPAAVEAAPPAAEAAPVAEAPAAAAPADLEPSEAQASDEQPYFAAPATPAVAPVIVRKRTSKLAALKAAEAPAPAPVAAPVAAPAPVAEEAPKVVRTRTRRVEPAAAAPAAARTGAGSTVSKTTDAAALAAIDTSGYLLPQVKVPGRRGRKPSEFMPENDEVAALNAVERAELKAVSKARERKAKGLAGLSEEGFSGEELEKRRQQLRNLINMGKERGYLTHAEINDHLPENIIDPEAIEGIIATFNDMASPSTSAPLKRK